MPVDVQLAETYAKLLAGQIEDRQKYRVEDALTTNDSKILLPRVIQATMQEAAEPVYMASRFFQEIRLEEGRSIEFPYLGAIRAHDIPEGANYPQETLDMAEFSRLTTEVKVNKVGLMVPITEEMIRDSQWDVIGLHLRAAGRAMARHREEKVFKEFERRGVVVFDNNEADSNAKTRGRGRDGAFNETLAVEDLIDAFAVMMANGFTPTDMIMHPFCWSVFSKMATVGSLGMPAIAGSPFNFNFNMGGPMGSDMPSAGIASPNGAINVVFSPWAPFDFTNKKFDIIIVDRNNVGAIVIKDELSTEQFEDPLRDIRNLKVRERYGVGVLHGGRGITLIKNVTLGMSYPLPERMVDISGTADLAETP